MPGHNFDQDLPTHPTSSMKPALFRQLLLLTHLASQLVSGSPKQHFRSRCWVWAQGREEASGEMRGCEGWVHLMKKYSFVFKSLSFIVSKI